MATKIGHQAKNLFGKSYEKAGSTREGHLNRAETIGDFMQGQGLRSIGDMKLKHCERFMETLKQNGLLDSTLANYATTLRAIADKIGKGDMIAKTNAEAFGFSRDLEDRRNPVKVDRDLVAKVEQTLVDKGHGWAGLAYQMTQQFGLRRQEALLSNQTIERDGKTYLVVKGAKGGRPREVEVKTAEQRATLERVQEHIKNSGGQSLCPTDKTLKQAKSCYSNHVNRAGGLRSQNAHSHANRHGWAQDSNKSDRELAQDLGHNRAEVVKHYK